MGLEGADGVEHRGERMGVMFDRRIFPLECAGAAIARHVPGDDPVVVGEGAELECPALRRPAEPVQQHQRRLAGFGIADRNRGAAKIDGFQFG